MTRISPGMPAGPKTGCPPILRAGFWLAFGIAGAMAGLFFTGEAIPFCQLSNAEPSNPVDPNFSVNTSPVLCNISGRVLDSRGQYVSLAEVRLLKPDGTWLQLPDNPCLTDCGSAATGGYFRFRNVPAVVSPPMARYLLQVVKAGATGTAWVEAGPGENLAEVTIDCYECLPPGDTPLPRALPLTDHGLAKNPGQQMGIGDLGESEGTGSRDADIASSDGSLLKTAFALASILAGAGFAVWILRRS